MGEVGIYETKTGTWDGLWRGTEVCGLPCSESFRYQAGGDQHQSSEEGSLEIVRRWEEMGERLVNGRERSA